jgi:hypothetical protein
VYHATLYSPVTTSTEVHATVTAPSTSHIFEQVR